MEHTRLVKYWTKVARHEALLIYGRNNLDRHEENYISRRVARLREQYDLELANRERELREEFEDERIIQEMKRWRI